MFLLFILCKNALEFKLRIWYNTQNFQSDPEPTQSEPMPEIDMHMVQKLTALIGKTGIDTHQKALLQALNPYLNTGRIQKLEKAMRAAKLASMATVLFGNLGR